MAYTKSSDARNAIYLVSSCSCSQNNLKAMNVSSSKTYNRRVTVTTPTPYMAHVSVAKAAADSLSIVSKRPLTQSF